MTTSHRRKAPPKEVPIPTSAKKTTAKKAKRTNGNHPSPAATAAAPSPSTPELPLESRPAAPPPPPKSLVKLIQQNQNVRDYFRSLQDNLEYDVRKWKKRAKYYQQQWEDEKAKHAVDGSQQEGNKEQTAKSKESSKDFSSKDKTTTLEVENEDGDKMPEAIIANYDTPLQDMKGTRNNKIGDEGNSNMLELFSSEEEDGEEEEGSKLDLTPGSNSHKLTNRTKQATGPDQGEEIQDDMLVFSSDDDNDEEEGASGSPLHRPLETKGEDEYLAQSATQTVAPPTAFREQSRTFILEELIDAYQCLQHVGVSLVVNHGKEVNSINATITTQELNNNVPEQQPPPDNDNLEHNEFQAEEEYTTFLSMDTDQSHYDKGSGEPESMDVVMGKGDAPSPTKAVERRSDEDVLADLVLALKNITRVQIDYKKEGLGESFAPFRQGPFWIPCGDAHDRDNSSSQALPDHPARTAKLCIFRALTVMDTYCGDSSWGGESWENLFEGQEQVVTDNAFGNQQRGLLLSAIREGMRNRWTMVSQFMESLSGEIVNTWAVLDRVDRVRNDNVLSFEPQLDDECSRASIKGQEEECKQNDINRVEHPSDGNMLTDARLLAAAGEKSQVRLSALAERRLLAQLLVHYYRFRQDPQQAFRLVWSFILSAAPSLDIEDYRTLPPVLSFVVFEGMLTSDPDMEVLYDSNGTNSDPNHRGSLPGLEGMRGSWFGRILCRVGNCSSAHNNTQSSTGSSFLRRALSLAIHATGWVWQMRLHSPDGRITDVARVELASYRRLIQSPWLDEPVQPKACSADPATLQDYVESAAALVQDVLDAFHSRSSCIVDLFQAYDIRKNNDNFDASTRDIDTSDVFAFNLASVLLGDRSLVVGILSNAMQWLGKGDIGKASTSKQATANMLGIVRACCMALSHLELRQMEEYREMSGSSKLRVVSGPSDYMTSKLDIMDMLPSPTTSNFEACIRAATVLDSCRMLSDGEAATNTLQWLIQWDSLGSADGLTPSDEDVHVLLRALEKVASRPVARVINLKRRSDRMAAMVSQAIHAEILVIKGVSFLSVGDIDEAVKTLDITCNQRRQFPEDYFLGRHAFDGKSNLAEQVGLSGENTQHLLDRFVAAEWRPNDLKPFDRDAPNHEHLVRISASERACALSHIATWNGVERALSSQPSIIADSASGSGAGGYRRLFHHAEDLHRLFQVSGYARGAPLYPQATTSAAAHSTNSMPPSPVCLILEDDAFLVDRFSDRLSRLLEELPRDFHFCSLGYSRPKTAPLIPYSSHVGIPTCLWYLTGYLVSLEGVRHLMKSLPVRGPIDSWIGLKMCANWDNRYGEQLGVGRHPQRNRTAEGYAPSKKQLSQVLQFKAFAALVPLCYQKNVGITTKAAAGGVAERSWRHRDTDIFYSGSNPPIQTS